MCFNKVGKKKKSMFFIVVKMQFLLYNIVVKMQFLLYNIVVKMQEVIMCYSEKHIHYAKVI